MNARFKQDERMGQLHTALGANTLVLLRMTTEEHVNDLFTIRVDALAERNDLDFDALIGTHATVELTTYDNPDVPFDGIISEVNFDGLHENGWRYTLTLKPWMWLAGLRRNQRIYHEKTVVEILDELLAPYSGLGEPAMEKRLSGSYPTLEYTVQYRESDLDFATRLMERFGISYHFTHDRGSHTLVLTDAMTAHEPLHGSSRAFKMVSDGNRTTDEEHFTDMRPGRRLTTGGIRLTDYNFKKPSASMETDRMGDAAYSQGQIESYDYPGDYLDQGTGKLVARLRTLQERGQDHRHQASGDVASLRAGLTVKVKGDKVTGVDDPCLCLSASHSFATASFASGQGNSDPVYDGSYVLLPISAPLAPERKTRIPVVHGPQTAVVVGEGEIDCDEYGRILVHFHWDLDNRFSMRCRVSQNWAGKGWGGMVIPRIGMEVVVEFLEGNPDKPLVTGCVYNGKNDVPYPLPANKTKSTFKTDTHKGGGFNELMFEDEKDEELIYMHGQKDQQIDILNDRTKTIGQDQSETVGRDKAISVGQDHTEVVGRDETINIGRDVQYTVGQNQIENYGKDHVHNVANIHKQDIFADHLTQVGRNAEHTVLGKSTLNVNQSITNNTKVHTLMAFQKFVIKGPGGKITLDSSGVTIEGAQIKLKGNVSMGGSGSSQVPTLQGAANAGLPLVEECPKEGE